MRLPFWTEYPVSEGHTLVVPKLVVIRLGELPPEVEAACGQQSVRFASSGGRYQPDGFNIGINDGRAAGQTIPHAHIHVIPRYKGDVPDPRGGIRWLFSDKAKYWP